MRTFILGVVLSSILVFLNAFLVPKTSANNLSGTEDETSTESAVAQVTSSYTLPYPGMLPDNPLYKLKVLRDKLILFLINDPVKKIDFYLLQADKGINAASMLVDKNKAALAQHTAFKAEHNMTLIVTELTRMPEKPDASLFDKLHAASKKHQLVLADCMKKVKGDEKKQFQTVLDFSKRNLELIDKYSKKDPKKWTDWSN